MQLVNTMCTKQQNWYIHLLYILYLCLCDSFFMLYYVKFKPLSKHIIFICYDNIHNACT